MQNNTFQQYGQTGLQIGATAGNASIDATILGNTFRQPGPSAQGAFAGIWGYAGSAAGNTNSLNIVIGSSLIPGDKNTLTDSDPLNSTDVFLGNIGIVTAPINIYRNGSGAGSVSNASAAQINAIINANNIGPLDLNSNTVAPINILDGVPLTPP